MAAKLVRPQRVVEFVGLQLVVPHDAEYLTIDCDGWVVAHVTKPWSEVDFWESEEEAGLIAMVEPEYGEKWMHTNQPHFIGSDVC